jgi:archaemetzincin
MRFAPPRWEERRRAVGRLDALPPALRRAFEPNAAFEPLPPPGPHDWLANHPEPGQTFEEFVASRPNRPDAIRTTIYLQPLDRFSNGTGPPLDRLEQFAAAFFMMHVQTLPAIDLARSTITTRTNPSTGHRQLLTGDILALLRRRLPADAYCVLGITMHDLYPDPAWNFVFGQASLRHRVGVYSFARYDPRFYGQTIEDGEQVLLRRSCKVLAHETAHMFGISHCIYFRCLMNGSNHLAESDARPLHLCPVDLRKLHYSVQFDLDERYRRLQDFCRAVGFDDEAQWLEQRLAHLRA